VLVVEDYRPRVPAEPSRRHQEREERNRGQASGPQMLHSVPDRKCSCAPRSWPQTRHGSDTLVDSFTPTRYPWTLSHPVPTS